MAQQSSSTWIAAGIMGEYLSANGERVTPPSFDHLDEESGEREDAFIAWYEDFVFERGGRTHTYCSADGSIVHITNDAQQAHCQDGHRWIVVGPEPTIPGSVSGWRQVA